MNEPVIRALPTAEEFLKLADELVSNEAGINDAQAAAYITTVLTIANPEDDHSMHLAKAAARHVFAKTQAFEDAFRSYAGYPERPMIAADRMMITVGREM